MSDLPDWTKLTRQEKGEAILPHLAAGESNGKIASRFLNCGRCQIAGAVNRMKVAGLNPPSRRTASGAYPKGKTGRRKAGAISEPKKAPAPKRTARSAEVVSWRGANNPHYNDIKARAEQRAASPGLPPALIAGTPIRPIAQPIGVPVPLKLDLKQLTDATCRWPHGDPLIDGFGFCGAPTGGSPPYCKYHSRLAFIPATVRQRASLRSAERNS